MVDILKVEQLARDSWYIATTMTYVTNAIAKECCMDKTYMIDLLAKHVQKIAGDVYYVFVRDD